MRRVAAALMLVVLFFVTSTVEAHPGRTDADGGHYVGGAGNGGRYHYHHGYPAHSHTNGECPYEHDDKTGHNSGTSGGGGGHSQSTPSPTTGEAKKKPFPWIWVILGSGGAVYCVYCVCLLIKAKREKAARAAIFEKEKKAFADKYSGKSLMREAGVPFRYSDDESIDIYVRYNSRTGKYHTKFCRYAPYGEEKSLADVPAWAQPCSSCRPGRCPQWLIDYKRIKTDAQKYGVDMLP